MNVITLMEISGPKMEILHHISGHMNGGDIPWNLALKSRPFFGRYLQSIGSWNDHWSYIAFFQWVYLLGHELGIQPHFSPTNMGMKHHTHGNFTNKSINEDRPAKMDSRPTEIVIISATPRSLKRDENGPVVFFLPTAPAYVIIFEWHHRAFFTPGFRHWYLGFPDVDQNLSQFLRISGQMIDMNYIYNINNIVLVCLGATCIPVGIFKPTDHPSPGTAFWLVGGLEHFWFFHILGIILPFDFHIFQRGRAQPPTSWNKSTFNVQCACSHPWSAWCQRTTRRQRDSAWMGPSGPESVDTMDYSHHISWLGPCIKMINNVQHIICLVGDCWVIARGISHTLYTYIYICIYTLCGIWSRVPCSYPPKGMGPQVAPLPFYLQAICGIS